MLNYRDHDASLRRLPRGFREATWAVTLGKFQFEPPIGRGDTLLQPEADANELCQHQHDADRDPLLRCEQPDLKGIWRGTSRTKEIAKTMSAPVAAGQQ
jgi:hypothetical protein